MSDIGFDRDEQFRLMMEKFIANMVTVSGFTFEEAGKVVQGMKRECDPQAKPGRVRFRVIEGGLSREIA